MKRSVVIKLPGYEASAGWTTYGTSLAAFSSFPGVATRHEGSQGRAILLSVRGKCPFSVLVIFILITELIFIKMGVDAALREQLLVRAALDDAPVFEREDDVSLDDRFQVVGDDDDGLACGQAPERLEHELFGRRV